MASHGDKWQHDMQWRAGQNNHRPIEVWDGIDPTGIPVCSYRCGSAPYNRVDRIPKGYPCKIYPQSYVLLRHAMQRYEHADYVERISLYMEQTTLRKEAYDTVLCSGLHAIQWCDEHRTNYRVVACERS